MDQNPDQMSLALGGAYDEASDPEKVMSRDAPTPEAARAALVKQINDRVLRAREYWYKRAFAKMIEDRRFAAGLQWPQDDPSKAIPDGEHDGNYVANVTLRHIRSRTASLYGKNPTFIARRKPRLLSVIWDGTQVQLQQAQMILQAAAAGDQNAMGMAQQAMAIMQEEQQVRAENMRMDRIAKTLELLFEHEIDEQPLNFKVQMKGLVRRALTTGVSYAKLDFERVMDLPPEIDRQIADLSHQLARLEQLAADQADGEFDTDSADAERLRQLIASLSETDQVTVREGLAISYPDSIAIIPDTQCRQLRGFVGCEWVAEEFYLTAEQIKSIYKVDVGSAATMHTGEEVRARSYMRLRHAEFKPTESEPEDKDSAFHCVWEVYDKTDGMVYVLCDGWPDFLVEPGPPNVRLERFWPWFPFVPNEIDDDETVFPPSDVRLMRDMQTEVNRARQGLREHRLAARPQYAAKKGVLTNEDKEKVEGRKPFDLIEFQGLEQGQKISDVLDNMPHPGVDPNLYDTSPAYEDYLRTLGQQEANLGGTSGATATEAAIAEGSRSTDTSATVDDLDEFLTEFARAAGQILLTECSADKVKKVIGRGAIWPEMSAEDVAREIYLDVEAASTGRPNRAAELQAAQQAFPLLMQIPNINPEFMGRELLRRMDDRLDLSDAFLPNMPSLQALNAGRVPQAGAAPGGTDADPNAQGNSGASNAPSTRPEQVNAAPRPPAPDPTGPQSGQPGPGAY